MEDFKDWVTFPCTNTTNSPDRGEPGWESSYPRRTDDYCCNYEFPMAQNHFGTCLSLYVRAL
jgi:hypothetical protein